MVKKTDNTGIPPGAAEAIYTRYANFVPEIVRIDPYPKSRLDGLMGRSASNPFRRTGDYSPNLTGTSPGMNTTMMRPYMPEMESPDRMMYPKDRHLANYNWRLFHKLDPTIGNAMDLYGELMWGNFSLTGEGVDGEILDMLKRMLEITQLRSLLPYFTKEFLVVGEVGVQNVFDDAEGIWTHIAFHNPDQLEVIDAPFIRMEPIVEFKPDQALIQAVRSSNPAMIPVRESMPEELLSALEGGQNIPLNPVNFTFIPRKLHPYDVRGVSLLSRMWRILMYEDAIYNASIQIARRHAAPLKVAKVGDMGTNFIPSDEQRSKLLELLVQAEQDVNAWLVYHSALSFEFPGTQERVMTIDKHLDTIERVKLVALGMSKAFLHGEVTYASASQGLAVFLRRLKAMRDFFQSRWLVPKFFKPVAMMNGWVKPTKAELDHKVRTRRSKKEVEDDKRWIIPDIKWDNKLDPEANMDMLNAMAQIAQTFNIKFSPTTIYAQVGLEAEAEQKQFLRDYKASQAIFKNYPELLTAPSAGGAGMGPDMGGGMPPGVPGMPGEPAEMSPGVEFDVPGGPPPEAAKTDEPEPHGGTAKFEDLEELLGLFEGEVPEEGAWASMVSDIKDLPAAVREGDPFLIWELIRDELLDSSWSSEDIDELEAFLSAKGILKVDEDKLLKLLEGDDVGFIPLM